jgi:hypothetical protein
MNLKNNFLIIIIIKESTFCIGFFFLLVNSRALKMAIEFSEEAKHKQYQ